MQMNCQQAEELITALADNELSDSEHSEIAAHLGACGDCRLRYERELALKRQLRRAGDAIHAPAKLRERMLHDRRIFPGAGASERRSTWRTGPFFTPALAAALFVLMLLPVLYWTRSSDSPVAIAAIRTHERILKGEFPVVRGGSPEEIKSRLSETVGGAFAPMTYDLSSIKTKAVAGAALDWNGQKVLATIYQGAGPSITCYTFPGIEADAPAGAKAFYDENKKINFYTYSRDGINLVWHREGKLICILVSSLPAPELLAVARKS
jgi:anti-sigma factor RsiW